MFNQSSTRIFGIDPGTATVGYSVLDYAGVNSLALIACGVIKTPSTLEPGARLKMIREDLLCLLNEYTPDIVVVEAIFFFKNAKTLIPVAQARGVILECAASLGKSIAEYTPMQVKLNLTGYGRADKKLVQETLARLFNHENIIKPDDAADALALAVCHARQGLSLKPVAQSPSLNDQMKTPVDA